MIAQLSCIFTRSRHLSTSQIVTLLVCIPSQVVNISLTGLADWFRLFLWRLLLTFLHFSLLLIYSTICRLVSAIQLWGGHHLIDNFNWDLWLSALSWVSILVSIRENSRLAILRLWPEFSEISTVSLMCDLIFQLSKLLQFAVEKWLLLTDKVLVFS